MEGVDSKENWNDQLESSIKFIGERALGYKIMHVRAARSSTLTYDMLMYAGIVCGPLAGLIACIGTILSNCPEIIFPIISAAIASVSAIFVGSVKFGKFEEQSVAHKVAAARYTSLESSIRQQLTLNRNQRIEGKEYLHYIGNSYDELFNISPLIPKKINQAYAKKARESGLTVPEEYALTVTIDPIYEKNTITQPQCLKRGESLISFPNFSKYSDGQMEYEMKRMMNI